jgi:hypothetical protein
MSGTVASGITVADFRGLFPEFEDSSVYLDEVVQPWLTIATSLLDPNRWGAMYGMGIALFTAHELALDRQAMITASRGGVPGLGVGAMTSKSINGVSVSYNPSLASMTNAGDFNLTTYGMRFIRFAYMFGSGGVMIVGADAARVQESDLLSATAGGTTSPIFGD